MLIYTPVSLWLTSSPGPFSPRWEGPGDEATLWHNHVQFWLELLRTLTTHMHVHDYKFCDLRHLPLTNQITVFVITLLNSACYPRIALAKGEYEIKNFFWTQNYMVQKIITELNVQMYPGILCTSCMNYRTSTIINAVIDKGVLSVKTKMRKLNNSLYTL